MEGVSVYNNVIVRDVDVMIVHYCVLYYKQVKDKTRSFSDVDEEDDLLDMDTDLSPWSMLVQWVAHWLACVHVVMEETRTTSPSTLQDLRRLKIIPLTNQSLVSLDSGAVFFPPATANKGKHLYKLCIVRGFHTYSR